MCGITGWIDWNKDLRKEEKIIKKMAQTLKKRGPDDSRFWSTTHAAFGHTRLVVIDPKGGKQPMIKSVAEKRYIISYNGELYNTEDIRKELLSRGHSFKSHSDTEVLLTSFIEWGSNCVDHLNGIFAFAIWDEGNEELFIARDRLGVKPLFYQEVSGAFLFGSELKAVLAHPDVKVEVTREGLAEIFGLGPSRTPGHGIFKNMKELRPGHALKFTRNGLSIYRYWSLKSKKHIDNIEQTAEKIRWLLEDTVERQLVADVPVSTFLSGGVDSSALTAFAAKYFEKKNRGPFHTYSVDYEDNDQYFKANDFQPNSDNPWIKEVSEFLGTEHHSCVITNEDLAGYLKESVLVRDLPGMADIDSSLLWFCRQVKKDVTVSLSGECADEIFGGYPWFYRDDLLLRDNFPWMDSTLERESLLNEEWREKLQLQDYVTKRYQDTLAETPRLDGESEAEARRRELFYLNIVWFMTTLLDRKDRMSMGASLEVRVPFADHRLVEYVWNIPWEMKNLEGREKGILRKALEGVLPNNVLYRKKSPYPKTHHPEYTNAVKTWLGEIVSDPLSPLLQFVDKGKITEIINTNGEAFKKPWFGQLMNEPQLMAHLCQIDTWLREYKVEVVE